jgi:hypothetical protein
MYFIVQIAALEQVPFATVKPYSTAAAALIQTYTRSVADLISQHHEPTLGTDFHLQRVDGLDLGLLRCLLRERLTLMLKPAPVLASRDPVTTALLAKVRRQFRFQTRRG